MRAVTTCSHGTRCGQARVRGCNLTSARERWEDHSGRSREPSSAEPDERCRVQTFEAEAQRRGVRSDAQEWLHTHGTAEFTTMPESATTSQSSRALEVTASTRAERGGVRRWDWCFPDHE